MATQSLFGLSPEQVQMMREKETQDAAYSMAKMSPMESARMGMFMAGSTLGRGLGQAMGGVDPLMVQAQKRQSLLQGVDITNPDSLRAAAQKALQANDFTAAQELAGKALEMEKALADIKAKEATAKKEQKLSIPAEIQKAERIAGLRQAIKQLEQMPQEGAGVAESLQRYKDELEALTDKETKYSNLARQLIEAGYAPGSPEFQAEMKKHLTADRTGKEKGSGVTIGSIGLPSVHIDASTAAKEAGKGVGKDVAGIEGPYATLDYLDQAMKKLDKGIFAGFYGPEQMTIAKATSKNNPKVINTEEFMAYIGNVVIPQLQAFGGNDSNEELKFLQRVMGGNQRLEPEAIKNILSSAKVKIRLGIERTQRQAEAAAKGTPAPLDGGPGRAGKADPLGIRQ